MNLRGSIISVLDLNLWFGCEAIVPGDRTPVIIVETGEGSQKTSLGILVENVTEIIDISAADVEATPTVMSHAEFILAMAKIKGQAKVLLDVHRLVQKACAA